MPQPYGKRSDMTARVIARPLEGTPDLHHMESVSRDVGVSGFPAADDTISGNPEEKPCCPIISPHVCIYLYGDF